MRLGRESRKRSANMPSVIRHCIWTQMAFTVLALIAAHSPCAAQEIGFDSTWPRSYRKDANLFDVCFVTANLGWAVGDRGTILHTQDGGQTWQLQDCPVRGRLESVHFIDTKNGWAVGGSTRPYSHRSTGYVLSTNDGGQTWTNAPDPFMPWLSGVHFENTKDGVAYGTPSAMYPSAAYRSHDGGQHWIPWPGVSAGWVSGHFQSVDEGLLLDRRGHVVQTDSDSLVARGQIAREHRLPLQITIDGQANWLVCGNQGLVRTSHDHGKTWTTPRGLPDLELLSEFDWQAVEAIDDAAWIVGVPGSRILTTRDSGRRWQLVPTGQPLPLYAVDFVDAQNGWAVGALGTVVSTRDGGQSWSQQRSDGCKLAAMGVYGQAEQIPWEMIAMLAAGEGYWTRIEVLSNSPSIFSYNGQTPLPTRVHESTVMLGGIGANVIEALPAPDPRLRLPKGRLLNRWNKIAGTDCTSRLTEYLVRQVRTWRPELIVVPHESVSTDGMIQLTRQLARQAVEQAADAQRFPSQRRAGLKPWRVSRVMACVEGEIGDGYPINRQQLVLSLGHSIGDLASRARANLESSHRPNIKRLHLRDLDGETPTRGGLIGRSSSLGTITRRNNDEIAGDVRQKNQQALRRRNLDILLSELSDADDAAWQQAMHLASELPSAHRGELFMTCAANQLRLGHSRVAFDLLRHVAQDSSQRAMMESARVQLIWYLASEEASLHWPHAEGVPAYPFAQTMAPGAGAGRARRASFSTSLSQGAAPVTHESAVATASTSQVNGASTRDRHRQAAEWVARVQAEQPDLYFEPLLRFPLAALDCRLNRTDTAQNFWRRQLSGRMDPGYRSWAASELALLQPDQLPSRPTWTCPRLPEPPRLDGQITDPVWQSVRETHLRSGHSDASAQSATRVRIAYDAEYLYFAAQAEKIPTLAYEDRAETRRRDEVLDGDRIEFFLDVDRDAVTRWGLAIDSRGGASERLNDDLSWNPRWYVAAAQDDLTWTVEAAIPLTALSTLPATSGSTWCLGIQRIMPEYDWETWLQTAPVEARPEEFGLLRFE